MAILDLWIWKDNLREWFLHRTMYLPRRRIKVLDFGLAKAMETEVSEQELANSPTLTLEATQEGVVLGTAAYMSPEQARGKPVDKRTDIWSFGLVLFEMLTGKGMYAGKSFTETIAAVIHQQPSLEELPNDTPRKVRELLKSCLRKDPRMRLRDMGDARITIEECLAGDAIALEEALVYPPAPPLWRRMAPWTVVPLLAVVVWSARPDPPIPDEPISRWEVPLDQGQLVAHGYRRGVALSPDGSLLAFSNVTVRAAKLLVFRVGLELITQRRTCFEAKEQFGLEVYVPWVPTEISITITLVGKPGAFRRLRIEAIQSRWLPLLWWPLRLQCALLSRLQAKLQLAGPRILGRVPTSAATCVQIPGSGSTPFRPILSPF